MELSEVKTSGTSKGVDLKNSNEAVPSLVSKDIRSNLRNSNEAGPSFLSRPFSPENDGESVESKEITLNSLDFYTEATTSFAPVHYQNASGSVLHKRNTPSETSSLSESPRLFSRSAPTNDNITVTLQPQRGFSSLPSPMSINILAPNQPRPLFLLALNKLNESNLSLTVLNQLRTLNPHIRINSHTNAEPKDIPAPDSLTSAPPSYSFVLRQIANRRRPRLMGTFIPSPSFVQHTPPPNYAAAFDIYVDNPIPAPPPRVFNFGFAPMPIVCPECGYAGITAITTKVTICTHLCAIILCLFFCWVCVPLPYVLRSCKDVYHYCRSCRSYLGMYCPTNPDNTYP